MDTIRKNFVTILVVGATVVLAGVAMFTGTRLYSLRQNPIAPNVPESNPGASDAPISIKPESGDWNLPEQFILTNISSKDVEVVWSIDCWDENLCEDSSGTETLTPGDTLQQGLGSVCSQWQINVNWTGTGSEDGDVWDFSQVSDLGPQCDVDLGIDSEQINKTTVASETPLAEANVSTEGDITTKACTQMSFTLVEATATPKSTATAKATATPLATSTPVATTTIVATATATPKPTSTAAPELPVAGIGAPTIIGITFGLILVLLSIGLAI